MTATASPTTGWGPIGNQTELPPGGDLSLAANAQAGRGQAVYFDATGATANVALNDGTVPGQVCAGVGADELSAVSTVAAGASLRTYSGQGTGMAGSTVASDGPTATDVLVPLFDAGNGTPGKLSNTSGNDRSFLGVGLGLNDLGYPIFWAGRIAGAFARMLHAIINETAGNVGYAADATATTDLGSGTGTALTTIGFVIPRAKRRSIIGSIEIIPSAALAAAGTNFRIVQIWKVDTTGGIALASSPLVATFTTVTQALVAGQPTQFSLGAASALLLRETDILVGTSLHTSGGATIPQSAIRANCKVI